MSRYEPKYLMSSDMDTTWRWVLPKLRKHEFLLERPTFNDPRQQRLYERIVKGAQAIADLDAGEKLHPIQKSHLDRLNVVIEDGKVRRWGYLLGPWLVRAYGHAVNLRVDDVHARGHPQYVRREPDGEPTTEATPQA